MVFPEWLVGGKEGWRGRVSMDGACQQFRSLVAGQGKWKMNQRFSEPASSYSQPQMSVEDWFQEPCEHCKPRNSRL